MEIIGIIAGIWILWMIIAGIVGSIQQKIRDKVAHEVLKDNFDYTKEKQEVLSIKEKFISIKENIKFLTPNIILETSSDNDYPVYVRNFCPNCKEGKLVKRKGMYGFFWGCSNYPKCRFIKNMK